MGLQSGAGRQILSQLLHKFHLSPILVKALRVHRQCIMGGASTRLGDQVRPFYASHFYRDLKGWARVSQVKVGWEARRTIQATPWGRKELGVSGTERSCVWLLGHWTRRQGQCIVGTRPCMALWHIFKILNFILGGVGSHWRILNRK